MRWFRIDELEFIRPEKNYKTHFGQRIKTFLVFSQIIKMYNLRSNSTILCYEESCCTITTVYWILSPGSSLFNRYHSIENGQFWWQNWTFQITLIAVSSFNVLKCQVLAIRQSFDFRTFLYMSVFFDRSNRLFKKWSEFMTDARWNC